MIELAVRTGIAPDVWLAQGERAIHTAFEVLNGTSETDPDEPLMRG